MSDIQEEFEKIEGPSGTKIFIFNVHILNDLKAEMNFKKCSKTQKFDLVINNYISDKNKR